MGITAFNGLFTLLVILASVGLVGVAALIVHALDRGVKMSVAKLKWDKVGTADRGSQKNRYASAAAPNQLGENCGVSEESTTKDVVANKKPANKNPNVASYSLEDDFNDRVACLLKMEPKEESTGIFYSDHYCHEDSSGCGVEPKPEELPYLEQEAISKSKAGVHYPFGNYPLPLTTSLLEDQIRKSDIVAEINRLKDRLDVAELDAQNCLNNLDMDTKPRVQNLESNAIVLAKEIGDILTIIERLTEMALEGERGIEALESLTPVIGSHGERIENLETAEKMWLHANPLDNRLTEVEDKLADSIFILYGGKKPDGEV